MEDMDPGPCSPKGRMRPRAVAGLAEPQLPDPHSWGPQGVLGGSGSMWTVYVGPSSVYVSALSGEQVAGRTSQAPAGS